MQVELDRIVSEALASFAQAGDSPRLEQDKARFLGKTGSLTELLKTLGKLEPSARKEAGAAINAAKSLIEGALDARRHAIADEALQKRLAQETIDVSLPGRGRGQGGIHPVVRTQQRVEAIFRSIGFDIADGPEIETDWYNFTALNNPAPHPARSMQDTFYVDMKDAQGRWLNLRPHTSPMQVR